MGQAIILGAGVVKLSSLENRGLVDCVVSELTDGLTFNELKNSGSGLNREINGYRFSWQGNWLTISTVD
jgi:hypothetical protein